MDADEHDDHLPAQPETGAAPGRPQPGASEDTASEDTAGADTAGADAVTGSVRELLAEVDEVRRQAGDEFSLEALTRQTELLERAHTVLTDALAEVDRR